MADANDGRVTLWRYGEVYFDLREPPPDVEHHEYIARPRADDDAREERLKAAEAAARVCREDAEANATRAERAEAATMAATRDRDEWKARAERAEAEAAQLRARIDAEAGGGKDGPTNDRNHDAAAASGAATPP